MSQINVLIDQQRQLWIFQDEQRSDNWKRSRKGRVTGSKAGAFM